MWRSLGRDGAAAPRQRQPPSQTPLPSSPPEDALPRPDGSRLQVPWRGDGVAMAMASGRWLMSQISKHQVDLAEKREAERVAKEMVTEVLHGKRLVG
eukprot:Skav207166  [mRNA]  locus=scaffold573:499078:502479:- [translate_table: standard]